MGVCRRLSGWVWNPYLRVELERIKPMQANNDRIYRWAQYYALMGWHIFPIVPDTKVPPRDFHWKETASCNPTVVQLWWGPGCEFEGYNIAWVPSRSGNQVLDVDRKPDKVDGWDTVGGALRDEPRPYLETPSGGYHFLFNANDPRVTGAKIAAAGFDVQSGETYALLPPSWVVEPRYQGNYEWKIRVNWPVFVHQTPEAIQ